MTKRLLDPNKNSLEASKLIRSFERRVVGQKEAVTALVDVVEHHHSGFGDKTRPAGSLLFLGPTGTGKTRVVESLARGLFFNEKAMVKIDCSEFQHSHEIAKLIGSPPGYLGHRETPPLLTQERIDAYMTPTMQLGIILFDEIEKASDALWQLLLGILDKATLTLGNNAQVNFSKQVIVMTSNLGSNDMTKMIDGGIGFGYQGQITENIEMKLGTTAINAAKKKFTAEFFNRIDKVVVFQRLTKDDVKKVLQIELGDVQNRLQQGDIPFLMHVSEKVEAAILEEGYSPKYGARELRRIIRKRIQIPLARLAATGQVSLNDVVFIDTLPNGELKFSTELKAPVVKKEFPVIPIVPPSKLADMKVYTEIKEPILETRPCGCKTLRGWPCMKHDNYEDRGNK